jgi:stress response protein YsnF
MTLRTLMQAGPAKANELFTKLAETSDGALKTRDRLFAELKTELEAHTDLEEQHLFPVLRKHAETKELVAAALKDNKDLRVKLAELEVLPKNDEAFPGKLSELRKAFRQHARDETKELLPAVQKALSEEQVQGITEKMETSVAEAEQVRHDQDEERRATARREREQAQAKAQQEEATKREQQERAEVQAAAEREQQAVARRAREVAQQTTQAVVRTTEAASESTRRIARSINEGAQRVVTASAAAPLSTGTMFWDMWLGMAGLQPSRSTPNRGADTSDADTGARNTFNQEEVIQLAEEFVTVEKRKVNTGTTHIHRYVVETPVEQQVTLVREKVVVERRRPVTDKISGETLTELTVEVIETDEVPVVGKSVRLKEEVVVRTERTEHVETVHETVRQDQVEIKHSNKRPARLHVAT